MDHEEEMDVKEELEIKQDSTKEYLGKLQYKVREQEEAIWFTEQSGKS